MSLKKLVIPFLVAAVAGSAILYASKKTHLGLGEEGTRMILKGQDKAHFNKLCRLTKEFQQVLAQKLRVNKNFPDPDFTEKFAAFQDSVIAVFEQKAARQNENITFRKESNFSRSPEKQDFSVRSSYADNGEDNFIEMYFKDIKTKKYSFEMNVD